MFEERYRGDSASTLAQQFRGPSSVAADVHSLAGAVAVEAFSYRPSLTRPILANAPA